MDVTHIRGMLLEEAVLFLLQRAGYKTIDQPGADTTLAPHGAGIAVKGRGAHHQIDAIADYLLGQPFTHPQRLLVEAKCYSDKRIGLPVVRNAVGVLKDVSEFWNTAGGMPLGHNRYHYHKAIFSVTSFSSDAELYAFAQDVYLFPLAASRCFQPVIDAIFSVTRRTLQTPQWRDRSPSLKVLRDAVRHQLQASGEHAIHELGRQFGPEFADYSRVVHRLGGVLLAVVGRTFPVFLVPSPTTRIDELPDRVWVRIRTVQARRKRGQRDGVLAQGWTLNDERNRVLFSFDLPPTLFSMYGASGVMTREAAAMMKEEVFSELQAITVRNGQMRLINFELEPTWLASLLEYTRRVAAMQRELEEPPHEEG